MNPKPLRRFTDGDAVSIQGALKAELYAKDGGEPKLSLSIIADHVLALRQPPKPREPVSEKTAPRGRPAGANRDFDDAIPSPIEALDMLMKSSSDARLTVERVRLFIRWHEFRFDVLDKPHEPISDPVGWTRRDEGWIKQAVWRDTIFDGAATKQCPHHAP